jgi:phage terminase large subunit
MILSAHLYDDELSDEVAQLQYVPEPPQRAFHTCPADHTFYGGAAGGGKTIALTMEGIQSCIEEPGIRVIYFRLTFDDLQQQVDETRRFMPDGIAEWKESRHRWEFVARPNPHDPRLRPRKSFFSFRYLDSEKDALGYQSREFDIIMFDEATQFSDKTIEFLTTRLRTSLPGGWPRLRMASNPGGISHQYLLEHWVEPMEDDVELLYYWDLSAINPSGLPGEWARCPAGERGRPTPWVVWRPHPNEEQAAEGELPATRAFIPAMVDDNPHVDRGYKRTLMGLRDESLRNALLRGDWHIFSGQAFKFSEAVHVRPDILIRPEWRKWRSIDWGWESSATCVLWHAYDPANRQVVTYRELYGTKINDKELCERILANTPAEEWIDMTVADRGMFAGASNEYGMTRADIFARYGVYLTPAQNNRQDGFARVQDMLAIEKTLDDATNRIVDRTQWVCTPNCYNLRRSLPTLVYDKTGKDIFQKNADDHAYDSLRYGLMATPAFVEPWEGGIPTATYKTF